MYNSVQNIYYRLKAYISTSITREHLNAYITWCAIFVQWLHFMSPNILADSAMFTANAAL